mmetsp:Transcript_39584/g.65628  ORF Transcript_39584/g.65628 Transcript_39584/m.65628 type:complete len:136 (+) Transcript_39584:188-595(+)
MSAKTTLLSVEIPKHVERVLHKSIHTPNVRNINILSSLRTPRLSLLTHTMPFNGNFAARLHGTCLILIDVCGFDEMQLVDRLPTRANRSPSRPRMDNIAHAADVRRYTKMAWPSHPTNISAEAGGNEERNRPSLC